MLPFSPLLRLSALSLRVVSRRGISQRSLKVSRSELTPVSFLKRTSLVYGDRLAVVVPGTKSNDAISYNYNELAARVKSAANDLRQRGVVNGDRVAYLSNNTPHLFDAHFAVPLAGAVIVAVNTRLGPEEIEFIIGHSGAKLVFVDADLVTHLPDLPNVDVVVLGSGDKGIDPEIAQLTDAQNIVSQWDEFATVADEEDTLSISYTSGTTGRPKGVMYTHRGAYLNSLNEIIHSVLTPCSVYLHLVPLYHCNGWCFPFATVGIGASNILIAKIDYALIWDLLKTRGITHLNGACTVINFLVNHPKAERLKHKVDVMIAASPPSSAMLIKLEELNMSVSHVYGLTETYGPTTINPLSDMLDSHTIESRGRLLARQGNSYINSDTCRVVDDQGKDVPSDGNHMGEVIMRGNVVMSGYYNDPEATAAAFEGGHFHSGDLGVMHPGGIIELRDRKKDIIISGGENISTIEVENVISTHPAVLEVCIVGVPSEKWGERPKAFIVLKSSSTTPTPSSFDSWHAQFTAHVRAHLAHFKCPDDFEIVLEIPKNGTGKVLKYVLRNREWNEWRKRQGINDANTNDNASFIK